MIGTAKTESMTTNEIVKSIAEAGVEAKSGQERSTNHQAIIIIVIIVETKKNIIDETDPSPSLNRLIVIGIRVRGMKSLCRPLDVAIKTQDRDLDRQRSIREKKSQRKKLSSRVFLN